MSQLRWNGAVPFDRELQHQDRSHAAGDDLLVRHVGRSAGSEQPAGDLLSRVAGEDAAGVVAWHYLDMRQFERRIPKVGEVQLVDEMRRARAANGDRRRGYDDL